MANLWGRFRPRGPRFRGLDAVDDGALVRRFGRRVHREGRKESALTRFMEVFKEEVQDFKEEVSKTSGR